MMMMNAKMKEKPQISRQLKFYTSSNSARPELTYSARRLSHAHALQLQLISGQ